ncbi:MAG: LysR family transcriptional regulator, partial [Verrucomicrobiota bacterium]
AKHGGISNACRHIPYGVQQPAVSSQLIRLEEELGIRLFQRKPFQLTDSGRLLYEFSAPFFGQLDDVEKQLKGKLASRLKLAGPSRLMRYYLPSLLKKIEMKFPQLQIRLFESDLTQSQRLLEQGDVDLAIVVIAGKPPSGFQSKTLINLPLRLLIPKDSPYRSATEAIKAGAAGKERLISMRSTELIPKLFTETLRKKNLHWPIALEVASSDMVSRYVSEGLGIGISVRSPGEPENPRIRALPLKGYPMLPIRLLWKERLTPVPEMLVAELFKLADIEENRLKKRTK